jgi:hypothetical protein
LNNAQRSAFAFGERVEIDARLSTRFRVFSRSRANVPQLRRVCLKIFVRANGARIERALEFFNRSRAARSIARCARFAFPQRHGQLNESRAFDPRTTRLA